MLGMVAGSQRGGRERGLATGSGLLGLVGDVRVRVKVSGRSRMGGRCWLGLGLVGSVS